MIRKFVALSMIAGCTAQVPAQTPVSLDTQGAAVTHYKCADGAAISAVYTESEMSQATVTADGRTMTLTQEVAASGVRYGGGKYVWWTKGDEGTLYVKKAGDEEIVHRDCVAK